VSGSAVCWHWPEHLAEELKCVGLYKNAEDLSWAKGCSFNRQHQSC